MNHCFNPPVFGTFPISDRDWNNSVALLNPSAGKFATVLKKPCDSVAKALSSAPKFAKSVPPVKKLNMSLPAIWSIKPPIDSKNCPMPLASTSLNAVNSGLMDSANLAIFSPILGSDSDMPSPIPPISEPAILPITPNIFVRVSPPFAMNSLNPFISDNAPKATINADTPPNTNAILARPANTVGIGINPTTPANKDNAEPTAPRAPIIPTRASILT